MKYFPVSLNLNGRRVTVVGGGEIAARRVALLHESEARIRVIAGSATAQIRTLADAGELDLLERPYRHGDLAGADLVLVATDDPVANLTAWEEARSLGVPINVADDPPRCDFIIPAIVQRGDLTVAISTNGKSPALAARLRRRISGMLGAEYARMLVVLDQVRERLKASGLDFDQRKRAIYRLIDSDLLRVIRESNDQAIEARIEDVLAGAAGDDASRESVGKVFIVGAGPGDPGLITVRGLECLRSADVVLHDRLIEPRLLDQARPDAQLIDVGKRRGDQGRMQHFIHQTMLDHARRGRIVCRLKGGDPFVFGRGGEEARALTEADVPFEIIPGVSSAIAAPAAAGIPLTHRDAAHSFLVMTGSRANDAPEDEWTGAASLIAGGGTLVVLMGLAHLRAIVMRLSEAGCAPDTPAALVSRGTFPDQEVRVGTLGTIGDLSGGVRSPAILVFGAVVLERDRLEKLTARSRPG